MERRDRQDSPSPVEPPRPDHDTHAGATEEQVGDRRGPGPGYDQEPEEVTNPSGVHIS